MVPTAPSAAAHPGNQPAFLAAQQPGDLVRVLFDGPPSWKAWFAKYLLAVVLVLVGLVLTVFLLAVAGPLGLLGLALSLAGVVWFFVMHIVRRSRRIRITTQTIDLESGVFGKTINTMQLWRVRDLDFKQSFFDRVLGVANIHILSSDVEQPNVTLIGLPAARQLFLDLRDAVAIARQGKNVLGVVS